jgi:hypothetical protein
MILMAVLLAAGGQARDLPCDAGAAQTFVGTKYGRHSKTRIRRAAGVNSVRVIMPGEMRSNEFRPDRATVFVDYNRRVASITCG